MRLPDKSGAFTLLIGYLFLCILVMVVCSSASLAEAASRDSQEITMDFDQVDINIFIKFISEITGKNFIVDRNVKGRVTILSPKQINVDEAYKVFESVLEINGLAAVPVGDITKIVPSILARQRNVKLQLTPTGKKRPVDTFVTQIIPLKHASAHAIRQIMLPLISKTGLLIAYAPTETLILTEYFSNIQRLLRIIGELDVPLEDAQINVLRLKHADATDIAGHVAKIVQPAKRGGRKPSSIVKIVADRRLNALIVLAGNKEMAQAIRLVDSLDRPTPAGEDSIRVVHLDNADAEEIVKVLTGLAGKDEKKGKTPIISSNVKIVADKATNSLVISAKPDEFTALKRVLKGLDQPRKQVYVEAAIMEVSADNALNFGVAWQGGAEVGASGRETVMMGAANTVPISTTSRGGIPTPIVNGLPVTTGRTFSFGVLSLPFTYHGKDYFSLGAFVQASRSDSNINVISTPQLMTLENEEAKVIIAENRPYQTSTSSASSSATDYSNYEYKDVGVTMKVTPQINDRGSVRMKIYQQVSRVNQDSATTGTLTPITRKREAETTVEVRDGETIVIAGLIEDNSQDTVTGIPILGDIPVLGWLFKTRSKRLVKKNMFIFLTPHVVDTPDDAKRVLFDKMKLIESVRYNSQGRIEPFDKPLHVLGPVIVR